MGGSQSSMRRRGWRTLGYSLIAILLLYIVGPSLIHLVYRSLTSTSLRDANEKRYHELASTEAFDTTLSEKERSEVRKDRWILFYWFHVRGWPIDEGEHDSILQSHQRAWKELLVHWGSN